MNHEKQSTTNSKAKGSGQKVFLELNDYSLLTNQHTKSIAGDSSMLNQQNTTVTNPIQIGLQTLLTTNPNRILTQKDFYNAFMNSEIKDTQTRQTLKELVYNEGMIIAAEVAYALYAQSIGLTDKIN